MKTFRLCAAVMLMFCCIFICGTAFSAGSGSDSGSGSDLGDLVVLLRNNSGVPILTAEGCQQPIAASGEIIPLDYDTCAVLAGYEGLLQAVEFGRTNVIRAPSQTIDSQLADLLVSLSTAECITLDPAGRPMLTSPDALDTDGDNNTTEFISKAVDSPLQNLAIYREMMLKGELGNPSIQLPVPFNGYGFLDTAAKALGAAIDKEGKIGVDQIVYLNQIMGLSDKATNTVLPKICIMVKEEVQGKIVSVEKCFLNYGNFSYTRSQTHGNLPYPAYITGSAGNNGTFEYLSVYPEASGPNGKPLFWITSGQIDSVVFGGIQSGATTDIGAFARATDDTREVISFMHSHPVMAGYETPIPCGVSSVISYDVALSALQVPVSMAVGTTREGTVTVTNEGPDPATGTVTIKGILANGDVLVSETFQFNDLSRGTSKSETFVITGPSGATTVAWTATVTAANDVQNNNNSLTDTTVVTSTNKTRSTGKDNKK